jgi:hypothetical protein
MRLRPMLATAATVALTATVLGAPAMLAGGPTTHMVDDDGTGGPGTCAGSSPVASRIQDAVDAAGPGDTILVCPGTYEEQVTIEGADDLTIRGTRPWAATLLSPRSLEAPWLVGIEDSDDVTVQWLRIVSRATQAYPAPTGDEPTCDKVEAAVWIQASTDVAIRSNRILAQGRQTMGRCGYGIGIMVGGEALVQSGDLTPPVFPRTRVALQNNLVRDFQSAGILSMGTNTTSRIIQNSLQYRHESVTDCDEVPIATAVAGDRDDPVRRLLRGAVGPAGIGLPIDETCFAFGIVELFGSDGVVTGNEVWSGLVLSAPGSASVAGEPTGALLLAGILEVAQGPVVHHFTEGRFKPQSTAPVISGNRIRGAIAGVVLLGGDLVQVTNNAVRYAFLGMLVSQTRDAELGTNRISDTYLGIFATDDLIPFFGDRASRDNTYRANTLKRSYDVSCEDETEGDGTDGTASLWVDNVSLDTASDPVGLCPAP